MGGACVLRHVSVRARVGERVVSWGVGVCSWVGYLGLIHRPSEGQDCCVDAPGIPGGDDEVGWEVALRVDHREDREDAGVSRVAGIIGGVLAVDQHLRPIPGTKDAQHEQCLARVFRVDVAVEDRE